MAAPRSATPSARGRPPARSASTGARRQLTAREIAALRQILANEEAFVGERPAATTATRPATARTAAPRTAVRRPAPGATAAVRRSTAGAPVRRPARKPVRRNTRAARAARAARRKELVRAGRRWVLRGVRLTVCAVAAPLLLSVVLPGPDVRPATGSPDATALALTAQTTLLKSAGTYRELQAQVAARTTTLQQAMNAERAARVALSTRQAAVGRSAAGLYAAGPQQRYPILTAGYLPAAEPSTELQGALRGTEQPAAAVRQAEQRVAEARSAVDAASRRAQAVLADVRSQAAGLGTEVTGTLAGLGAGAQQARNQQAVARWQAYLQRLADAGIQPPPAAAIADPDSLPDGMSPALDAAHHRIPGVVWAVIGNSPVTVLPAETVAAVSTALSQLGKPFAAATTGPDSYDCGGFTSSSWLLAGYALPATPQQQWATGAAVPPADLQVGDLVFSPGGQDVGIYLGDGEVVGASAANYRVDVRSLVPGSSGVRVPLPVPAHENAPLIGGFTGFCGAALTVQNPAWGGFSNGRIPRSELCPLGVGSHALRCDAATAYRAMSDAFAAAFGAPICITDSYRSYDAQLEAFREKPALAAVPGTSNHGWGLAVDLCGGINGAGSPQWTWMQANAPRFGFLNPQWARPGAEKPEPWHWEFGNYG